MRRRRSAAGRPKAAPEHVGSAERGTWSAAATRIRDDSQSPEPDRDRRARGASLFAAVDALHARLTAEGFAPDAPARSHAYTFYVKAPGGFVVEVLC
jgi:hypothetical protein